MMAEPVSNAAPDPIAVPSLPAAQRMPRVEIEYCVGCRWMMRAAWTAQELLTTFESELAEVALVPGRAAGIFQVRLDGEMIFDRMAAGGFPELRALKQIIRDRIAPARDLGHSDLPADQDAEGES